MNIREFVEAMAAMGVDRESAEGLIWIAASPSDLTARPFNFVRSEGGIVEILEPDGRGGYTKAQNRDGTVFAGASIEDAYGYVAAIECRNREIYREWLQKRPR